jgi:Flp pilus assembly protein TadG
MPKPITPQTDQAKEKGQSLVELALFIMPILALLLIAAIELTQVFTVYIALINSARAGSTYASLYPETRNCADPPESDTSAISTKCIEYSERVKDEIIAVSEVGFGTIDTNSLDIDVPVMYSPNPPTVYANCPITTTVTYQLSTIFSSSVSLPLVGRMGLPSSYTIRYSVGTPIREAEDQHATCLSYTPPS